ncbi:S-formylglutathione hydrolase [Leisingera thetidis]|uniref:S-formylglutathione hydrolase n=1 Tax=Leisingera thetidis TaxID=2930199 RepID=UPI0021F79ED9|nr:S-formylglutathione hydrolase [Leisingera thetidis]
MELVESTICFGGKNAVYRHPSDACSCDMTFGIYLPPQAESNSVPVLWYLSGLTCTHENAMTKASLQQFAAKRGLALVFPDTSPRGEYVADDEAYDLGQGAGFYVNATQEPWARHFRMYNYVARELYSLVCGAFPVTEIHGITGHSMGGHGALTLAIHSPGQYRSVSAFAPIANPSKSDWGRKQLGAYLGTDEASWLDHDASLLLRKKGWKRDILVDQGGDDQFLDLLRPQELVDAATDASVPLLYRTHSGYNHSYFFVASFAEDHVNWHADRLTADW